MQGTQPLDIALIGFPGLLIGLMIGYIVGGRSSLRLTDRLGLGIMISVIGGLIFSLLISYFIPVGSLQTLFVVLAFSGGYALGMVLNWSPPFKPGPQNHIIYEPDDDDAFDREIEEALGGKH